jgi:dTDP-4-amino-4,6-dideoxygalactose transaminase
MTIGRTVPPAAAPLGWSDVWHGLVGALAGARALESLAEEIRREFRVRDVFLLSSGKAALTLTLMVLKSLSHKRDVVIPAYTCFSVPAAVLKAGLRPVLCDIDPVTFDFDHERLSATLTDRTLCVVAHHLFGMPAAIEKIRAMCRLRRIYLVEDAAQAMGAESGGRRLGTMGDVGIFSLGRGKNITCGSGGIIVTSSPVIGDAIGRRYCTLRTPSFAQEMKDFLGIMCMMIFVRPWLYWIPAAVPALGLGRTVFPRRIPLTRLSGIKAGLLRNWRSRLAAANRVRAGTAAYFSRRLSLQRGAASPHPYLRLPVVVSTRQERDRIYSLSRKRGLGLSVAYPAPVNEIPEIRAAFSGQCFPAARRVSEHLVTLPTHHWLSDRDKRDIADLCSGVSAA